MTIPVTICDDSNLARKQMARSLPAQWDIDVTFANDGVEGLAAVRAGKAEVLFLDLTMPNMDGYQVLEHIKEEQLNAVIIVVSGDIQPTARERVKSLGAIEFIKKPIDADQLSMILEEYGLLSEVTDDGNHVAELAEQTDVSIRDSYQEVANVAMGRAAELLAQLLDAFVVLPIPSVNNIELSELKMALDEVARNDTVSSVCQGFIGNGISGEALTIFNDSSFADIARLMRYDGELDQKAELELLMDIASILSGSFLKAFADQLDIQFSQGHPVVLGQHCNLGDLLNTGHSTWQKTLAIEVTYRIEGHHINCDLLILFTEDSVSELNHRVSYYSS